MFGEVEIPAEVLANGILACQAPPLEIGRVPFYVTCSNRFACSEVREFEYREGFAGDVNLADFFNSSTEMLLHLRLDELLSLNSVHPSKQIFEDDMEKRNLILKLISLKEEEEYSSNEEPYLGMDVSRHRLTAHMFHRQIKEKLYSWLLHKVTETGKGPHVLGKDGQGMLHLVAALGYDWAIAPIVTAGVNINFRDVNGWTALHWAASCGSRCVAIDNQGNFIFGFAMKIHPCSVVEAELWALFHGVSMAMEKQFVKVVMESDSQGAIDFLVGGSIAVNSTVL